jgi:hypothetical protein
MVRGDVDRTRLALGATRSIWFTAKVVLRNGTMIWECEEAGRISRCNHCQAISVTTFGAFCTSHAAL